jgi:hypothetical protein
LEYKIFQLIAWEALRMDLCELPAEKFSSVTEVPGKIFL